MFISNDTVGHCGDNATGCGFAYNVEVSSTWKSFDCNQSEYLTPSQKREQRCGYDRIEIDSTGAAGDVLPSQSFMGTSVEDGSGLALNPYHFDNRTDPRPTFLGTLKKSRMVPSLSFGMCFGVQNG